MDQTAPPLPQPYRQALPAPVVSTRGRGWGTVAVDAYEVGELCFVGAHREHLVSIQLAGEATLYQSRDGDASEQRVGPGHVIVTPAGSPKTWRRRGQSTLIVIAIPPSHLGQVFERATGRAGALVRPRDEFAAHDGRIAQLGKLLWQELRDDALGSRLCVEAALEQLAVQVLREHADIDRAPDRMVSISPHKLRLAKAYIQQNLGEELPVEAIARAVGMSAFHFAHAFREATGVPPHRYVIQRRIERAKQLLRESELSLTEIAQRVGYSSASHFSVGFRKITRVAPSEYRKAG